MEKRYSSALNFVPRLSFTPFCTLLREFHKLFLAWNLCEENKALEPLNPLVVNYYPIDNFDSSNESNTSIC